MNHSGRVAAVLGDSFAVGGQPGKGREGGLWLAAVGSSGQQWALGTWGVTSTPQPTGSEFADEEVCMTIGSGARLAGGGMETWSNTLAKIFGDEWSLAL
jgi:hypothetical protein